MKSYHFLYSQVQPDCELWIDAETAKEARQLLRDETCGIVKSTIRIQEIKTLDKEGMPIEQIN